MKTAPHFHLYVLAGGRVAGLEGTGLEPETLADPGQVEQPALVLLGPGQKPPQELAEIAIEVPADASPSAVRELVRVGMENIALKEQVTLLEGEAHLRHRQFRELNRIPKLAETARKYIQAKNDFELAFWMEMVLEGMHQALRLSREDLDSTITFHELMKFNVLRTVK